MRHKNNEGYYQAERDAALMRAYRQAFIDSPPYTPRRELVEKAIAMPTERFYCTVERATIVISDMMKGVKSKINGIKREMYEEIFQKVEELRKVYPYHPLNRLVQLAISSPAPKLYMTAISAERTIFYIRRKCKKQKRT